MNKGPSRASVPTRQGGVNSPMAAQKAPPMLSRFLLLALSDNQQLETSTDRGVWVKNRKVNGQFGHCHLLSDCSSIELSHHHLPFPSGIQKSLLCCAAVSCLAISSQVREYNDAPLCQEEVITCSSVPKLSEVFLIRHRNLYSAPQQFPSVLRVDEDAAEGRS